MRAHGIASGTASVKSTPARNFKYEQHRGNTSSRPSSSSLPGISKKRKIQQYLEDQGCADDDEWFGGSSKIKPEGESNPNIKEQNNVKEEDDMSWRYGQMSLDQAVGLMPYYKSEPSPLLGDSFDEVEAYGSGDYESRSIGDTAAIGSHLKLESSRGHDYDTRSPTHGDISYEMAGMPPFPYTDNQGLQYSSAPQYSLNDQGFSYSPFVVEEDPYTLNGSRDNLWRYGIVKHEVATNLG